jgi:ATP-binding cassette subfamily C protein
LIRLNGAAIDLVLRDLQELEHRRPSETAYGEVVKLKFDREIRLDNVSYHYPASSRRALDSVSIKIPKGAMIGFIGPSGSGKTTLVDIILGLLEPTAGSVLVDGQDIRSAAESWQRCIGYIPQNIFLIDDSIRANVAFGIESKDIVDDQVWAALRVAQLEDFVRGLAQGLDTEIGERGVRMSGGQRQRLGIARALYHNPDLLILDEATSALDTATEREVSRAVQSLIGTKTLIVVAHRLSTLEKCDQVYRMVDGRVSASGSYQEICT